MAFCQHGVDIAQYLNSYEFFKAASCVFISTMGMAMTATLVYGAVSIPITVRTNSIMIPVILLLLTGGATFATVIGPATSFATIAIILAGPGAITLLLYAYSR